MLRVVHHMLEVGHLSILRPDNTDPRAEATSHRKGEERVRESAEGKDGYQTEGERREVARVDNEHHRSCVKLKEYLEAKKHKAQKALDVLDN